jgi:NitT/TauT family transport system permease protein
VSERVKSVLTFVTSIVVLAGGWELYARSGGVNPIILPPPSDILDALWFVVTNFFGRLAYWEDTWITFYEIIFGFLLGSGTAIVVGSLVAEFEPVRRTVIPYTIALNSTPKIAIAPLFVIWFGFGAMPKILIAAVICFFPVFVNTVTGLKSTEEEELELMASIRASRWQTFLRLKLPRSAPFVFAALRTAMAFAAIGAVIGEFAGASEGLGFQIEFAAARLETARLFAFLILLSVLAFALYSVISYAERKIMFWTAVSRMQRLQ